MKEQSSWICTIFIQISLCLIVYVSLHLGHNQSDKTPLPNLSFLSVSGGYRSLNHQTHLLRLVERVANTYNVKFVLSISELGEEDPLFQNATRVSSSLKLPWYITKTSSGYFKEHFSLPYGGSLDIVFGHISLSQQNNQSAETSNSSTITQLEDLTKILKATNGDWRIVVGPNSLNEDNEVSRTFHQIMTKYGVKLIYISNKDCNKGSSEDSFTCITVPNTSDTKRENEDGIVLLLHRVGFSEFVTYGINSSGEVMNITSVVKQKGKEVI